MSYRDKMEYVIDELGRHDISAMTVAPPAVRLLWLLNVKAPPPLYMTLQQCMVYLGLPFGIMMAMTMGVVAFFLLPATPAFAIIGLCLLSGPYFGYRMHSSYRKTKSAQNLPSWDELTRGYEQRGIS